MVSEGAVVIPRGTVVQTVPLQVPWQIAAGAYEKLTDEELNEHAADINAELGRRGLAPVPEPGSDG